MTVGDVHAGDRDAGPDHWHQALAYAVTGRRLELGRHSAPAVRVLADQLHSQVDVEALAADVRARLERGEVWPYSLPADLAAGLGPAQFAAALQLLTRELGLVIGARRIARVDGARPADPAERRLLHEVPPHHGG